MNSHPIDNIMRTALQNIKEMVDVNTILGNPVETPDGNVVIPISKVTFGFAAGGSEFETLNQGKVREKEKDRERERNTEGQNQANFPFGGGSGAGITIHPVAFLVVGNENIKLLPVESNVLIDRVLDSAPDILERVKGLFKHNDCLSHKNGNGVKVK